jgi:chromosome segregation ATPase
MGKTDPCAAEEQEVTRLTEEVWKLQRELKWVNDPAQGKVLADLKAKEARGETGHRREIEEIETSIKNKNEALQRAAYTLGEAEKRRDACREKEKRQEAERQRAGYTGGGQTR